MFDRLFGSFFNWIITALLGLLFSGLTGCSALHWVGPAARAPGAHVKAGPIEISVTGDTSAHADRVKMGDFEAENLTIEQRPSVNSVAEVGRIDAIGRVQRVQVDYVSVLLAGVRNIIAELMPLLKLLAMGQFVQTESGLQMTLPNGFSLGKTTINKPADMTSYLQALTGQLQQFDSDANTVPLPAPSVAGDKPAANTAPLPVAKVKPANEEPAPGQE